MAEILAMSTLDFLPNFDIDLLLLINKISSVHWLVSSILGDVTVSQGLSKILIYDCGRHWETCMKDAFGWEVRVQNGYSIRFSLQNIGIITLALLANWESYSNSLSLTCKMGIIGVPLTLYNLCINFKNNEKCI